MKNKASGRYRRIFSDNGDVHNAFIPDNLPSAVELPIDQEIRNLLDRAFLALGRLDSVTAPLPDPFLFLYMYVRKEAVLSSQIEGTQSSLSDLLMYEAEGVAGVPVDDVREVSNYVSALNYGLETMKNGLPLSLRLIRGVHRELLSKGRGCSKDPGNFRKVQNWLKDSSGRMIFIPPPPDEVAGCMNDLENFLHDERGQYSVLLKAAMAHVQFETVHPFLDGNGRLGRLLITMILCAEGILTDPMLYLSLYFKTHRQEYYNRLQQVRTEGDWNGWIRFFLTAVKETSEQAVLTAKAIVAMADDDRKKIQSAGKAAGSMLQVHHAMLQNPIMSIPFAAEKCNLAYSTISSAMVNLQRTGIVREVTGNRRNRMFAYNQFINILNEGTEPIQ